jgi:hypothetical protein
MDRLDPLRALIAPDIKGERTFPPIPFDQLVPPKQIASLRRTAFASTNRPLRPAQPPTQRSEATQSKTKGKAALRTQWPRKKFRIVHLGLLCRLKERTTKHGKSLCNREKSPIHFNGFAKSSRQTGCSVFRKSRHRTRSRANYIRGAALATTDH